MDKPVQRPVNKAVAPVGHRPMPAPPVSVMAAGTGMTPKEIMGILRRHIWMIILLTVLGTVIGGASWFVLRRTMPRYTAVTHIEVLPPIQQDPSQITAIQPQRDIYFQFRATKAAQMTQQNMLQELLRHDTVRETNWYRQFTETDETGAVVSEAGAVRKALRDLDRNFRVSAPRDLTFLVVSMRAASPREAQRIVNTAVDLFLRDQRERARRDTREQLAERTSQRDSIRRSLENLQGELDNIREGSGFARLDTRGGSNFRDYMDQRLANIEQQVTLYNSERGRLSRVIETLRERATALEFDDAVREQIERDPVARQMRSSIASMEPMLERQLARFGEEHRAVKETRAALEQMRSDLAHRQHEIADIIRQSNYIYAQDQMAALSQQHETTARRLQEAQAEYRDIDRVRAEFARVDIRREEMQNQLEEMNMMIEKLNTLDRDPSIHKLRSAGRAAEPLEVSFPRLRLFLPGGFILGLLGGLGLAFAIELLNDLLRTPSDVMRHIKMPLMGMVYHADDDRDLEEADLYHVFREAPYSITSECYRQLRTNLKLSGDTGRPHKTLLITSPAAGDGKTTLAVNMAGSMLTEDKRVLVIDANFRRPMSGRLFPPSQENGTPASQSDYGLSNYLMGQCSDEKQIIRPGDIPGLFVIDGGPLPANPAELLSSDRMQALLEHCKAEFDYVIIDGPAMVVSDARTLAAQADGTLVVFNAETTHRGAAIRILRELRHINANAIGTVLMGVRSRKGGYFREVYRSYHNYQNAGVQRQPVHS